MKIRAIATTATAAGLLLPAAALAHPGHSVTDGAFAGGLLHPLTGLDHLLAMVAVGLWAALCGGRALWALPAVEPVILASVIVLGALVALAARLPVVAAAALVALFGLAHGHAHGTEGPAAGLVAYVAGFGLATAGLHAAGLGLGLAFAQARHATAARVMGGAAALTGVALVFL